MCYGMWPENAGKQQHKWAMLEAIHIPCAGALPLATSARLCTPLLGHNQPQAADRTNGHCPFPDQPGGHEQTERAAQSAQFAESVQVIVFWHLLFIAFWGTF